MFHVTCKIPINKKSQARKALLYSRIFQMRTIETATSEKIAVRIYWKIHGEKFAIEEGRLAHCWVSTNNELAAEKATTRRPITR
ncbi:MAG: hypothetical protein WCG73_02520, partial [Candidatus Moraniibacteriota bacterium]